MTHARGPDVSDIKAMLQAQILGVAQTLVPDGGRKGAYWIGRNPTRDDKHGGSFWVRVIGNVGIWKDEATGDKGDVLKLIAYVEGHATFRETMDWARAFLGLQAMTPEQARRAVDRARTVQRAETAGESARAEAARRAAFGWYCASKHKSRPFLGSPADVYLRSRGIDVTRLGRMPGVLGWLPDVKHHEAGTTWPCLIAGLQNDAGETVAIHRTFLARDGAGKAPVSPVRKIWPAFGGCAVRLWRGSSKMSVDEAASHGLLEPLVLCEGVEDGLSIALACPDLRVWCAGSLGNLAAIRLPACCETVIVAADNDWGKPQAQRALDKAVAALSAQGRAVSIARSHIGKDFNDALRADAKWASEAPSKKPPSHNSGDTTSI